MAITSYEKKDRDRVMDLWLKGNLAAHPFIPAAYWQEHFQQVAQELEEASLFLWNEEGKIEGFLGLMEGGYIAGIFVDEKKRGHGIGSRLIQACMEKQQYLSLKVYCKNEGALRLYRRLGFRIQERAVEKETGEEELTMVWEKDPIR